MVSDMEYEQILTGGSGKMGRNLNKDFSSWNDQDSAAIQSRCDKNHNIINVLTMVYLEHKDTILEHYVKIP
jgi:hypothetical protein